MVPKTLLKVLPGISTAGADTTKLSLLTFFLICSLAFIILLNFLPLFPITLASYTTSQSTQSSYTLKFWQFLIFILLFPNFLTQSKARQAIIYPVVHPCTLHVLYFTFRIALRLSKSNVLKGRWHSWWVYVTCSSTGASRQDNLQSSLHSTDCKPRTGKERTASFHSKRETESRVNKPNLLRCSSGPEMAS